MRKILLKICLVHFAFLYLCGLTAQAPVGLDMLPSGGFLVENVAELNTPYLDYSAVSYFDGVVFTSARGGKGVFVCDRDLVSGRYSDLYFAKADAEGRFFLPEMLRGEVNGKYHDGTATFTTDGQTMIFSRNNRQGQNKDGIIDLKIYTAARKRGEWVNTRELHFNSNDFATCHPALSPDGSLLFFASNRPGGYGGMDLYVVKKVGDDWGAPINLGPEVNTAGNEIFPFVATDGMLYFSSDGHPGMGGLDIFSVTMNGVIPGQVARLPEPLNSPNDDFGFTADAAGRKGYLTSDRPGGKGQDDIYRWRFNGLKPVMASICVLDKETGARVGDASLRIRPADVPGWGLDTGDPRNMAWPVGGLVSLKSEDGQPAFTFASSCDVQMAVLPGSFYVVEVNKKGYAPVRMQVSAHEMTLGPEYLVTIKRPAALPAFGTVRDRSSGAPLPLTNVRVRNNCTGTTTTLQADAEGGFRFEWDCRCDYEITAERSGFGPGEKWLKSAESDCGERVPAAAIYLEPAPAATPVLEVGTVIELENVYYDYDRFFIRSDAAVELDRVVALMRKYPSLEIELGSHTDSRGSDSYNLELSQKRAEAAVVYIISKGIDSRRIKAKGYGETQLVNHCANGVPCSEAEHQQNRRTEIKVTRLEEKGVRFTKD